MDKIRALIADDSKVMRLMIMKGLRQARLAAFSFEEAEDGAVALEKINAQEFDIVFLDWNMPEMSGIDVVREVRGGGNADLPIVMITSEKSSGKIHEAIDDAGANAFIHKPFTPEQMEEKLESLIEGIPAR